MVKVTFTRSSQIILKSFELFFHILLRTVFNLRPVWPTDVYATKTLTDIQIS